MGVQQALLPQELLPPAGEWHRAGSLDQEAAAAGAVFPAAGAAFPAAGPAFPAAGPAFPAGPACAAARPADFSPARPAARPAAFAAARPAAFSASFTARAARAPPSSGKACVARASIATRAMTRICACRTAQAPADLLLRQPVSVSPVQPRPAAPPAAVPSMQETELEQVTNLSAALGAYGGGEMFYAYVSSSLQQLRERRGGSPLAARAPSPVPQARAVASPQGPPPAPTAPGVAVAQESKEPPTESSADLGECAEALLELSRTTTRRPRDSGAPSAEAQTTWNVWSCSPVMDPSAVTEQLKKAEESGDINSNSCRRLEALHELLTKCEVEGIVAFETETCASKTCILGWSKMLVKKPAELNSMIREMVKIDLHGSWRKANGMHAKVLKNPTWSVYTDHVYRPCRNSYRFYCCVKLGFVLDSVAQKPSTLGSTIWYTTRSGSSSILSPFAQLACAWLRGIHTAPKRGCGLGSLEGWKLARSRSRARYITLS
jgi:hypothetical protein